MSAHPPQHNFASLADYYRAHASTPITQSATYKFGPSQTFRLVQTLDLDTLPYVLCHQVTLTRDGDEKSWQSLTVPQDVDDDLSQWLRARIADEAWPDGFTARAAERMWTYIMIEDAPHAPTSRGYCYMVDIPRTVWQSFAVEMWHPATGPQVIVTKSTNHKYQVQIRQAAAAFTDEDQWRDVVEPLRPLNTFYSSSTTRRRLTQFLRFDPITGEVQ